LEDRIEGLDPGTGAHPDLRHGPGHVDSNTNVVAVRRMRANERSAADLAALPRSLAKVLVGHPGLPAAVI
jgi:hypothetical protein